jgi:hypothetical protein
LGFSPNPSTSDFTLLVSVPNNAEVQISLLDLNGKLVRTIFQGELRIEKTAFAIDAAGLSSGIYFLQLSSNDEMITKKIVRY